MISIYVGPLQTLFFCGLVMTLFYFFISTSSVISLIKQVTSSNGAQEDASIKKVLNNHIADR